MEFDKSKVYTANNADELKVGSKVIVADTLSYLKIKVKEDCFEILKEILDEDYQCRFRTTDGSCWKFAYIVSEPVEEKKLKWTDKKYHQKKINEALKIFRESHLTCASDGRSYDYDGNYNMGDIIIINVIAKLLERIEKSEWNNPKEKLPTKDCEVLIEYDEHKTHRVVDWNNKSQHFGGFSIDEVKRWKEIE